MSHTAEDLCEYFMPPEELERCSHGDVKHGFLICFPDTPPKFDIQEIEDKVNEMIKQDLPVTYCDSQHVSIGGTIHPCSGPRIHVSSTGQIQDFYLLKHFVYDKLNKRYLLVGYVGEHPDEAMKRLAEVTYGNG